MTQSCSPALKLLLVSLCSLSASCTTGPKRENDSALDYLNGHNYQAGSPTALPIVVMRQAPSTTVSGVLLVNADPFPLPLKYQTVILSRGQTEIARSMSDSNGEFVLAGTIPNGSYSIGVDSDRYTLSQALEVSSYKTLGLRLVAALKGH